MANWQGMQLTKHGRALMAKLMAHENGSLSTELTRIALGGGILSAGQKLESMTGLIDEHTTLPISNHSIIGNEVVQLEASFKSGDFPQAVKLHEIGVFANDPDIGEILYAYDNATEGDTIPANGGSSAVIRTFRILLQVANAANVSLTIIDDGSTAMWEAIGKVQDNIDILAEDLATTTTEQADGIAANTEAVAEIKTEIAALAVSLSDTAANAVRIATDAEASAGVLETVAVNPKQLAAASPYYVTQFMDFFETVPLAGWMVRDGSVISNASTAVPKLYAALQLPANAGKLKTESQWQALSSVAGGVGGVPFFVLNIGANTIRLPDTRGDYARCAGSAFLPNVGDWHLDAIRNIKGELKNVGGGHFLPIDASGVFKHIRTSGQDFTGGTVGNAHQIDFDPSLVVPTANENRTRAFAMLGCVYVGV